MTSPPVRRSVRALIVDEDQRLLLCRHDIAGPPDRTVWAAPGGGIEPDESDLEALARELREEVGLVLPADPPLVWRQTVIDSELSAGYDGIANDYYLVETLSFAPAGELSDAQLLAENVVEVRWWAYGELADYTGPHLFSPRDLAVRLNTRFQGRSA